MVAKFEVFNGNFTTWEDVVKEFTGSTYDADKAATALEQWYEPTEVIYANYDLDGYEGTAVVVWKDKRKYYLLQGGHCSCYGLEETGMDPEVYTKEELLGFLKKAKSIYGMPDEVMKALIERLS